MNYNPRDRFFLDAKKQNYLARSVFKLKEIDQRFNIFKPGQAVFDLGCSPGSWSQYASQVIGNRGRIVGIDLTEMRISLPNAQFFQADIDDVLRLAASFGGSESAHEVPHDVAGSESTRLAAKAVQSVGRFDVVMSDMAPKTTGIKSVDQDRSYGLCELALQAAIEVGAPQSKFVCKFFQSGDFGKLRKAIAERFKKVEIIKPESTRSISKEIFFVGIGKR